MKCDLRFVSLCLVFIWLIVCMLLQLLGVTVSDSVFYCVLIALLLYPRVFETK